MITFIFTRLWWILDVFIFQPIKVLWFPIQCILVFILDFDLFRDVSNFKEYMRYQIDGSYSNMYEVYTTKWHYLFGCKPINQWYDPDAGHDVGW